MCDSTICATTLTIRPCCVRRGLTSGSCHSDRDVTDYEGIVDLHRSAIYGIAAASAPTISSPALRAAVVKGRIAAEATRVLRHHTSGQLPSEPVDDSQAQRRRTQGASGELAVRDRHD